MTTPPVPSRHRSAVTNGKRLHVVQPGDTAWARRFRDVLTEITNDLGGADLLSEGQRQLIRRATTISIMCEKLEGDAAAGEPINLELYGRLTDRLGRAPRSSLRFCFVAARLPLMFQPPVFGIRYLRPPRAGSSRQGIRPSSARPSAGV